MASRYYLSSKLSYCEVADILAERGVPVDHSTLNLWIIKYAPLLEEMARQRKKPVARSWRMDETYVSVNGQWKYYYRAVDRHGNKALALHSINIQLWLSGAILNLIEVLQVK